MPKETWALFSKQLEPEDSMWVFRGFTNHDEFASEFEDEAEEEEEIRKTFLLES